jgi:hypothetical protein
LRVITVSAFAAGVDFAAPRRTVCFGVMARR